MVGRPLREPHELVASMTTKAPPLSSAIPRFPLELKRNDIIRIREPGGYTVEVKDPSGNVHGRSTPEWVDVRVTGVKVLERHSAVQYRARVNVQYPDGSRRAHFFEQNAAKMEYARGFEWAFPLKVVLVADYSTGLPCDVDHSDVPSGRYVRDDAGDLAYRCGPVGVWLRVGTRWAECPVPWLWSSDPRKWSVEL